jgi:hypothetical protein
MTAPGGAVRADQLGGTIAPGLRGPGTGPQSL